MAPTSTYPVLPSSPVHCPALLQAYPVPAPPPSRTDISNPPVSKNKLWNEDARLKGEELIAIQPSPSAMPAFK